ncbi:MAG: hypothetical protein Q9184_008467, partial [Pyrenodesmia sp. 2 TL-2023]
RVQADTQLEQSCGELLWRGQLGSNVRSISGPVGILLNILVFARNKHITNKLIVIQGTSDISNNIFQEELSQTIHFCFEAWNNTKPEARAAMFRKLPSAMVGVNKAQMGAKLQEMQKNLHAEEVQMMDYIRARQLLRTEDSTHVDNFSTM